jgi:hypothetical protein
MKLLMFDRHLRRRPNRDTVAKRNHILTILSAYVRAIIKAHVPEQTAEAMNAKTPFAVLSVERTYGRVCPRFERG